MPATNQATRYRAVPLGGKAHNSRYACFQRVASPASLRLETVAKEMQSIPATPAVVANQTMKSLFHAPDISVSDCLTTKHCNDITLKQSTTRCGNRLRLSFSSNKKQLQQA